jgi:Flp pilus assembly protein TadD
MKRTACAGWAAIAAAALVAAGPAWSAPAPAAPAVHEAISRAIEEQRLTDAALMLDRALISAPRDPQLQILSGDLELARQHPSEALVQYRSAEGSAELKARALEGEGLALAMAGRFDEARPVLQHATAANPSAWRAWNALGVAYDEQQHWPQAEDAYAHALENATNAAIVLNNRGYSRLLQSKLDAAGTDFMDALRRNPDLAEARTNLRLTMALRGDYDRSIAGASVAEKPALLNNAGFAAALRGEYDRANQLLTDAISAKGEYYSRAAGNQQFAQELAMRSGELEGARPPHTPARSADEADAPRPAAPAPAKSQLQLRGAL